MWIYAFLWFLAVLAFVFVVLRRLWGMNRDVDEKKAAASDEYEHWIGI